MVQDRLRDGKRIAQLVASELTGDQATLANVVVAEAVPDVEPTDEGAFAYRVVSVESEALGTDDRGRPTLAADALSEVDSEIDAVATVFVHPERARIEFEGWSETAATELTASDLPHEQADGNWVVFIPDGRAVKRVVPVVRAVVTAASEQETE